MFYHTHSKWGVMPKSSVDFTGNPSSAFTVAELGAMLPSVETLYDNLDPLLNERFGGVTDDNMEKFFQAIFKAEEVASWLIYLLENKHITATEVNKRLTDANN